MNSPDLHLCSDHGGEHPTVLDLPHVPASLKREWLALETRRHFLGRGVKALGAAGLASLFGRHAPDMLAAGAPAGGALPAHLPHYAPKAKRAIYLFMAGSPSQFETWDHKPVLQKMFDQDLPESVRGGQVLTGMTASQSRLPIAPSLYKFAQHGKTGTWVTELFPHTAKIVDELCIMKSLHTEAINHEPAILQLTTGNMFPGRPSMGAWLSYGLGAANDELPTFVVMTSKMPHRTNVQALSNRLWSSGFLSPEHAAVTLRGGADPVLHLSNPAGIDGDVRRAMISGVNDLNRQLFERVGDPRDQRPHRAIRDGVSHADLGARAGGFLQRAAVHLGSLRPQGQGARHLRLQLPHGAPPRRARRALHADFPPQLGPAQPAARPHQAHGRGVRPGDRRARHRSQAPRPARRHRRALGRRVWPHRLFAGHAHAHELRPRSPPALL